MTLVAKLFVMAGPLLLVLLTGIAGYTYVRTSAISLPIPATLSLLTVFLPLLSGVSTYFTQRITTRVQRRLTPSLLLLLALHFLPDTIIATLLFTYILPVSSLRCTLETQWMNLFRTKNERAIRSIQDTFNCCGLNSIKDRAFPFPANGRPSTCATVYGRSRSCFADWRDAEQGSAEVLVAVIAVLVAMKVFSLATVLRDRPWTHARWAQPILKHLTNGSTSSDPPSDRRANMRRLIEEGAVEEGYRDDVDASAGVDTPAVLTSSAANGPEQGPRVQPSGFAAGGQEWREEGASHGA